MESVKPIKQGWPAKARLRSMASPAAAIALALFAAAHFTYANILWNPGYYGEYGLGVDLPSGIVGEIVPGSPADKAGIKLGDRIAPPPALRERLLVAGTAPHPGERIALSILRQDQRPTATLQARPVAPFPAVARVLLGLKVLWLFIFIGVGFILVLLRPSFMTWGFYLFALNLILITWPGSLFFSYIPSGWFVALTIVELIIAPAGVAGFLIFCVSFPANAPTGWRKIIQLLALCVFAVLSLYLIYGALAGLYLVPFGPVVDLVAILPLIAIFVAGIIVMLNAYFVPGEQKRTGAKLIALGALGVSAAFVFAKELRSALSNLNGTSNWAVASIFVLGAVAILLTYSGARGSERLRIKWVLLGLLCAGVAHVFWLVGPDTASQLYSPAGATGVAELLYAVLPIALAYAVFRHRVIDVRFVVSRSLAIGVIIAIIASIVVGIDWVFSTRLPDSRFDAAVYVGVALLVGFSLNAARQWIGKTSDFLLFRPWHRTQERADSIADALRRASSKADLYEPLTAGVAEAFSLASVALFDRVEDGGFVRVAARGWPAGTIWHILPDDPLVVRAGQSPRAMDLDVVQWHEPDLPAGVARPTVVMPIVSGKMIPAMLLCGAHVNGAGLDPDELRAIRTLCADAGLTYGVSPAPKLLDSAFLSQQREPLGA